MSDVRPAPRGRSVYEPSPAEIRAACDAILARETQAGLLQRRGWLRRETMIGENAYTIPSCRRHI